MLLFVGALATFQERTHEVELSDVTYRFGGQRWRVVCSELVDKEGYATQSVRVFQNGKRLLTRSGEYAYNARLIPWPYRGRLLAVSQHTLAGHGMWTWFYRADRRGVIDLKLELDHEVGGPVFRDLDRDGRPELVFDNDDWYEFYGDPPTRLRAFKFDGKRLRLWREFPNRQRERLPFKLPYF